MSRPTTKVGDFIKRCWNADPKTGCKAFLGKTSRVVSIDKHGRPKTQTGEGIRSWILIYSS